MAFNDFLTGRKKNRDQRIADAISREQHKQALQQDIRQKATIMKELIADPRYAPYRTILEGAMASLSEELDTFTVKVTESKNSVGEFAHGMLLGRLLGRKQMLKELLVMPESIVALSEQRHSPEGNGRDLSSPSTAQAAS